MEGNTTERRVPAQLRRRAEEPPENAGAADRSVLQMHTTSAPIHPATLEALAALFPAARVARVDAVPARESVGHRD